MCHFWCLVADKRLIYKSFLQFSQPPLLPSFINLLVCGICGSNVKSVISKRMWWIKFMSTSCEIALMWMSHHTFGYRSTLVRVMTWYCNVTSHPVGQYWLKSTSPYFMLKKDSTSNYVMLSTKCGVNSFRISSPKAKAVEIYKNFNDSLWYLSSST